MTIPACPCGAGHDYTDCCQPYLEENVLPETAEALMRSRYTAYVREDIAYLKATLWPAYQPGFDFAATAAWAADSHWTGLTVVRSEMGGARDREGTVLFEARYLANGKLHTHRELSRFRKKAGRWYYVEAI